MDKKATLREDFRNILMYYERQDGEFEESNVIIPFDKVDGIVEKLLEAINKGNGMDEVKIKMVLTLLERMTNEELARIVAILGDTYGFSHNDEEEEPSGECLGI